MDWRRADVLELISMYRESECLWNPSCAEYKDIKFRNNTWKDFADHFDKDVYEIKKKIKNLRCMYNYERKRIEKATKISDKNNIEPRLYYYDEMTFLDPVIVMRPVSLLEQSDPLTEKRPKRLVNSKALEPPKKIMRFDYEESVEEQLSPLRESTPTKIPSDTSSSPIDRHTSQITTASEDSVELSKEQTFCAMLCSELKLLNSEDVYDNVTAEIFSIVKNAKVAERQIIYQPEEDGKHAIK
ncbi:uncharacterized protein [Eurosta solidaginis]|uniref:uncharacterized protein isoform X1 n=1 Tax=Eurosta solidaginis TaxID=178769 RepID=UPI00353143F6